MKLVFAATATLVMACSSEGDPKSGSAGGGGDACGPLRVVVDGRSLTGLGPVYGVRLTKGTAKVWHVETTDGPGHSCEEVLGGGRPIRKGENVVAADISSDKSYFTGVRHGGHTLTAFQPEKLVRLDGAAPAKVGDPIAICVDTDVVKDVSKGLEIHGALRGTYCGEP
jgi:hypothetical protein